MTSEVTTKCAKCGKTIAGNVQGSLTSWLFRPINCSCEITSITGGGDTNQLAGSAASVGTAGTPLVGALVDGKYEIVSLIGSGGMGSVYKVRALSSGNLYALKMLNPNLVKDESLLRRFRNEAQAIKALEHPNIVAINDVGESSDQDPYLVMDYVEGKSLEQLIAEEKQIQPDRALKIFHQVADALNHAHTKGVIHRDLKPSNILISRTDAGEDAVRVVDFGIAKIIDDNSTDKTKLTQTGELIGSPQYMSPEQCKGLELDGRSDIYSLGCIMYEALSGRPPFDGDNPVKILLKQISETAPKFPKELRLSAYVKQVVMQCLAKDRTSRYPSAQSLLLDLQRVQKGLRIRRIKRKWTIRAICKTAGLFIASTLVLIAAWYLCIVWYVYYDMTPYRPDKPFAKSLTDLNRTIEEHPQDSKGYDDRGEFHLARDERSNAIDDFTTAIKLNPRDSYAYWGRSYSYTMLSEHDNAMADANKLIQLSPKEPGSYVERALTEFSSEQYHQAIADCEKSLTLKGTHERALSLLCQSYNSLGAHQKAFDCATKMMERYPGFSERGSIYVGVHQCKEATADYNRALFESPKYGCTWAFMAIAYAKANSFTAAMQCIKHEVALDTFPARAHRLTGEVYRAAGKWQQALEEYSTSTSLEPWYGPAFMQKAIAEIALGELNSALLDLRKAVEREPNSSESYSYLAMVENQLGQNVDSSNHMAKALSLTSDLPMNFVNRARIQLNDGQPLKALEDCNSALALDGYLADAYQARAIVLDHLGKKPDAALDHATALKLGWRPFKTELHAGKELPITDQHIEVPILRPQLLPLKPGNSVKFPPGT